MGREPDDRSPLDLDYSVFWDQEWMPPPSFDDWMSSIFTTTPETAPASGSPCEANDRVPEDTTLSRHSGGKQHQIENMSGVESSLVLVDSKNGRAMTGKPPARQCESSVRVCPTCSQEVSTPQANLPSVANLSLPRAFSRRQSVARIALATRSFECNHAGCSASFPDSRGLARHRACVHEAPITLACGAVRKNRRDNVLRHIRKCLECGYAKRNVEKLQD